MTAAHSIFAFYDLLNVGYLRQTKRKKKKRKETKEEVKPEREEITRNNCVHFPVVHINDISFLFFSLFLFSVVFFLIIFSLHRRRYIPASLLRLLSLLFFVSSSIPNPETKKKKKKKKTKFDSFLFGCSRVESNHFGLCCVSFHFLKEIRPSDSTGAGAAS